MFFIVKLFFSESLILLISMSLILKRSVSFIYVISAGILVSFSNLNVGIFYFLMLY